MAYSTRTPPFLVTQTIGTHKEWVYKTNDPIETVRVDGYFTNGYSVGIRKGDSILVIDQNLGINTLVNVTSSDKVLGVNVSDGLNVTNGGGGSSAVVSLDAPVTSSDVKAQHAYGVDRMVDGYTGNTLRLERLSDNVQEDFGFTSSTGIFDLDAVDTWRSGADVNVVTIYDQIGAIDLTVTGTATLIVSDVIPRFGTTDSATDLQLTRSTTNGGVGINFGGNAYFGSGATKTNFDTTGGFDITMLWSQNERKVTGAAAGTDPFSGNADDEDLFNLITSGGQYFRNRLCTGDGVDAITLNTSAGQESETNPYPYKQYAQQVATFSVIPTELNIFRHGGEDPHSIAAPEQAAIESGEFNEMEIRIGDTTSSRYPNMILGGFILSKPYTAAERMAVHAKLNVIGQQHQKISEAALLEYFDEIVLLKNIDPVTGVVVGEKGKLTLNFTTTINAGGTPDWDFEYDHPLVGLRGVRSPTSNPANGFIATDNYFAQTHTGSILSVDILENSGNDLTHAFSQATGAEVEGSRDEWSLSIGRDHNQYSASMLIANTYDDDDLISTRTKSDETGFGAAVYDGFNQAMGKYNRNVTSAPFTYDEVFDSHTWDEASWKNESGTQPYLLDAPVVKPCADNLQYTGKDDHLGVSIATFEKDAAYNLSDDWTTRKPHRLKSVNSLYLSDGRSPIAHRDGAIAINPRGAVVHSRTDAKIMSLQNSSDIAIDPFFGTRFAMGFAKEVWAKDTIEKIQVNLYKLLV